MLASLFCQQLRRCGVRLSICGVCLPPVQNGCSSSSSLDAGCVKSSIDARLRSIVEKETVPVAPVAGLTRSVRLSELR